MAAQKPFYSLSLKPCLVGFAIANLVLKPALKIGYRLKKVPPSIFT